MPAKYTYDFVKYELSKENYTLLTSEYSGRRQFLKIKCPNGHIFDTTLCNWMNAGVRCFVCSNEIKKQKILTKIKSIAAKEHYEILSNTYEGVFVPLLFRCPAGHMYYKSWHQWYSTGRRCAICNKRVPLTYSSVKYFFESLGYKLLTEVFINRKHEMPCICPNGHMIYRNYNQLRSVPCRIKKGYISSNNNGGCPICFYESISGANSSFWRGGVWSNEYCIVWQRRELKEFIKHRDNYKCINPYCKHTHFKLSIHHVDYNKKNCTTKNLITLCNSCNSLANFDQEWHTAWYQAVLNKRYGYIYL